MGNSALQRRSNETSISGSPQRQVTQLSGDPGKEDEVQM